MGSEEYTNSFLKLNLIVVPVRLIIVLGGMKTVPNAADDCARRLNYVPPEVGGCS